MLNVDTKNLPGLKRRALSQSLPALLFRTLRTLADSRKKDAKHHGSNLNYKLDEKKLMVFVWQVQHFGTQAALLCGRCWALEV